MQAYEIRKVCLGLNHVDTLATLVNAIVQLLNSSNTRVQLARAEPMCGLMVKCSMAMQVDTAGCVCAGLGEGLAHGGGGQRHLLSRDAADLQNRP